MSFFEVEFNSGFFIFKLCLVDRIYHRFHVPRKVNDLQIPGKKNHATQIDLLQVAGDTVMPGCSCHRNCPVHTNSG